MSQGEEAEIRTVDWMLISIVISFIFSITSNIIYELMRKVDMPYQSLPHQRKGQWRLIFQ